MAAKPLKWIRVTIPEIQEPYSFSRPVSLRTVTTGRGKNAVERWQREISTEVFLDGSTVAEAVQELQRVEQGLEDARVVIEDWDESNTMKVVGWREDVSEQRIAKAKAQLAAQAEAQAHMTAEKEAADKAKLLELARQYPGVLEGLK